MNNDFLYRNGNEYISLITFKSEEVNKISELAFEDFGPYLTKEHWESVVLDGAVLVNSELDKRAIYLLQLACADIIAPIRKDFMRKYLSIEMNCESRRVG